MECHEAMASGEAAETVAETEVLVIGGGLAGLFTALCAAETGRVTLVTEGTLLASNSYWAQGGVAAAVDDEDTPLLHAMDTLRVGGGLNNPEAVRILSEEGPARIGDLLRLGVLFDGGPGGPHLGLEGGHSRRRILHAAGSATGSRIVAVLAERVRRHPAITVCEETVACALLSDGEHCSGALLQHRETGQRQRVLAPATVVATGGASALYSRTTNPPAARGAGIALAAAAGAAIADMEFVQFHPTTLALPNERSFLLSEALRGEGAYLLNAAGERFMLARHELGELAPRDVVARAIVEELGRDGTDHVYLSLRHLNVAPLRARFANIDAYLRGKGLDLATDLLPVAPAAHYLMGGIATDNWGATTVAGLLACGEVTCTGVHGANRLASNSLLECLVFGARAARAAVAYAGDTRVSAPNVALNAIAEPVIYPGEPPEAELTRLREALMARAGLVRDEVELAALESDLAAWRDSMDATLRPAIDVAAMIARSARLRTESRGAHLRADYPAEDPSWAAHIILQDGTARIASHLPTATWLPMTALAAFDHTHGNGAIGALAASRMPAAVLGGHRDVA